MKTNNEFLKDIWELYGNEYDYSLVEYRGSSKKIKIICHQHGVFNPTANNFLSGSKCPKCSHINKIKKLRSNKEEFISKSVKIHGDQYDYSLVEYKNNKTKVKIICGDHVFEQRPDGHLSGRGCSICSGNQKKDIISYLKEFTEIHGDQYDYSLVEYINTNTKVEIICKEHGIFNKTPKDHLNGIGCQKCKPNYRFTTESFIEKSENVHGNLYDYSLVSYINSHTKVEIICKEHGIFTQKPYKHINESQGCPSCKDSKGVSIICNYLHENDIEYIREEVIGGCVSENNVSLRFDFYLPKLDIYIEYDGEQHFTPVKNWGGEKAFEELKIRDKIKDSFCEENNIKLYRISYMDDVVVSLKDII